MDGDDVSDETFAGCLTDLATVNSFTLARPPTLAFVREALRRTPADRPLTLLDVGFGAGDMLRAVHRLVRRHGRSMRLVGIDLNPRSLPVAIAATPTGTGIEYRTGDLLALPFDEPIDLVISSLVTHHMTDKEIIHFVDWMDKHATIGWLINDLHRHPIAYHGFRLLAGVMRWHPFVRHDGPLSVARAFRRADWSVLLKDAGVDHYARMRWRFPFRYCVTRWKS